MIIQCDYRILDSIWIILDLTTKLQKLGFKTAQLGCMFFYANNPGFPVWKSAILDKELINTMIFLGNLGYFPTKTKGRFFFHRLIQTPSTHAYSYFWSNAEMYKVWEVVLSPRWRDSILCCQVARIYEASLRLAKFSKLAIFAAEKISLASRRLTRESNVYPFCHSICRRISQFLTNSRGATSATMPWFDHTLPCGLTVRSPTETTSLTSNWFSRRWTCCVCAWSYVKSSMSLTTSVTRSISKSSVMPRYCVCTIWRGIGFQIFRATRRSFYRNGLPIRSNSKLNSICWRYSRFISRIVDSSLSHIQRWTTSRRSPGRTKRCACVWSLKL